jgi:hypothetical protein
MSHDVLQWPASVYPGEVNSECPEALQIIAILILNLQQYGPSPEIYRVKSLGKKMGGLWQINLKIEKRQVRVLYAPYGRTIVLFRIHKKGSRQEQQRAYELAKDRKRQYEVAKDKAGQRTNGRSGTSH